MKGRAASLLRWIAPVVAALAAVLVLPGSALAARPSADQIRGIEYSATATVGTFAGAATGILPGAWRASVVHQPITAAPSASITGGSFQLYGHRPISGRFVDGAVTRLDPPTNCANERFDVRGDLGLDDGGTGQFAVVLTHLRAPAGARCVTYGATVTGTLALAPTASAGV